MLTPELQKTINRAAEEALARRHEYLTLEHLLYSLLEEKTGADVIKNCGGNLKEMASELEQFMNDSLEKVPFPEERIQEVLMPDGTIERIHPQDEYTLSQTAAYERVLRRAIMQAHSSGHTTIESGNVIAAMFEERRSHATYLLEKQGITRLDVLSYISHGISKLEGSEEEHAEEFDDAPT
ncbi:MAG: hypothetical protein K8F91_20670 [Candidatus Obscuribacterales bacterium]|nr:hypothetical protein [Candidatus Obscuribacterales bacterium]